MKVPIALVVLLLGAVVLLAISLFPTPLQIGEALQQGGRLDEALQFYLVALRGDPKDEPIRVRTASVYERRGQPEEAIALYEELTVLDPNDLGYRRQLATLYDWSLRVDDAIVQKEKIAELDPKDVPVRLVLADYYVLRRKDYGAAVRRLEDVVAVRPYDADALAELGRLYTQSYQLDKAREAYQRALAEDPTNAAISRDATRLQTWRLQLEEAIERDRATLAANPNDLAALQNLAELLRRTGQAAEAETIRQRLAGR